MVRAVRGLGLEACCTLGHADRRSGQGARRRGPDRVQPQPRHIARVLRSHHHDAHLRRSARDAGAGAGVPGSRSAAAGSSAWARTEASRYRLLQQLASLDPHPESVPVNLLVRVEGTPLADRPAEDPLELVRTIATARILMPASFVRLSAGRLSLTDEAQALCFLAGANSVFLGERLLTTPNPGTSTRRPAARQARHAADAQGAGGRPLRECRRVARSTSACAHAWPR